MLGKFGFLLSIFLITALVSCVCSNAATVVAFYSVLRAVEVPGLRLCACSSNSSSYILLIKRTFSPMG